jgi:hypothetical protein
VAAQLRAENLLNNDTCTFKDSNVSTLVQFTQRLAQRLTLTFKKQMLFDSLDSLSNTRPQNARIDAMVQVAAGLRHWIGLTLLPRYIRAACDILERDGKDPEYWNSALDELEEKFTEEASILRLFEQNLREKLGEEVTISR